MRYENKRLKRACERTVGEEVTPIFDYYKAGGPDEIKALTKGKKYLVKDVWPELGGMYYDKIVNADFLIHDDRGVNNWYPYEAFEEFRKGK